MLLNQKPEFVITSAAVAPPPCQPPPTTFSASQFYNGLVQLAAADGTTPGESVGSITNSIDQPSNVAAAGGKRKRSRRGSTVKGHLNVTREENGALLAPQGVGSDTAVMPGSWSGGQTVLSSGPLEILVLPALAHCLDGHGPAAAIVCGQTMLPSGPLSAGQTECYPVVDHCQTVLPRVTHCLEGQTVLSGQTVLQWSIIWRSTVHPATPLSGGHGHGPLMH